MATYYIGADVHSNNTELAKEIVELGIKNDTLLLAFQTYNILT